MFVLGLLLVLLSAGALIAVLASGTDDQAAMYGGSLTMPTLVVFLAGAAALLVFIMGLELVRSGLKRANQNRRNTKRLRKLERHQAEPAGQPGGATTEPGPAAAAGSATPASGTGTTSEPGTSTTSTPGTSTTSTPGTSTTSAPGTTPPSSGTTPPSSAANHEGPYQTPPPAR